MGRLSRSGTDGGRVLVSELRALMKAASRKHGLLLAAPQAAVAYTQT